MFFPVRNTLKFALTAFLSFFLSTPVQSLELRDGNDYIVLFKDGYYSKKDNFEEAKRDFARVVAEVSSSSEEISSIKFKNIYKDAVLGVLIALSNAEAKQIGLLKSIKLVERDSLVYPSANKWGLDRINQINLPLDGDTSHSYTGDGVNIYIVDTGINPNHSEFSGRIGVMMTTAGGSAIDCEGHGTNVAGVAAGSNYGVATQAIINSIKISGKCGGSAKVSDTVEAFNWIVANAAQNSVVNYSYTSSSHSIRYAMDSVIQDGHVLVSAAGNANQLACNHSNKKSLGALIVGATTSQDKRASFSNYGSCVDVMAPGEGIYVPKFSNNYGVSSRSGTSLASPFIAGIAALFRQKYPGAPVYQVAEAIVDGASTGVLSQLNGSPNKLAYVEIDLPASYWQQVGQTYVSSSMDRLPSPGCSAGDTWIRTMGISINGHYPSVLYSCQ